MNWKTHSPTLEGTHALLSPSQYSWINYDEDKLVERVNSIKAIERGTELHALAATHIKHKITMPRNHATLNEYINDAIGFRMKPEVLIFYSRWCYGTADAISFRKEPKISKDRQTLRIHDLKTGAHPAKLTQLEIYAALFCLEYGVQPSEIEIVLRIYQFDDIQEGRPTTENIVPIMDKIRRFSNIIEKMQEDAML